MHDLIEVFEEFELSWAYYAFRESHPWDFSRGNTKKDKLEDKETSPTKSMLKKYFVRNHMP